MREVSEQVVTNGDEGTPAYRLYAANVAADDEKQRLGEKEDGGVDEENEGARMLAVCGV